MFACASGGHGHATVDRLSLAVVFTQAKIPTVTTKYIKIQSKTKVLGMQ